MKKKDKENIIVVENKSLNIAMLGHKHMLSREGGIEIVVKELATRMSKRGHHVVVFDRSTHHVSGDTPLDNRNEVDRVKIIPVWTIEKKGLAAMTSSLSAAWKAAWGNYDVVHIHAEGPAAMCGLVKTIGKIRRRKIKVIVTIHGRDDIIEETGRKASKIRLRDTIVSYPEHKYTLPSIPVLTAKPAYAMPES